MTKHMNAIRLLLQIKSTRLFIGERDKTAEGAATTLKRQGKAGRVEIHTNQGQHCVWRLPEKIVAELLALWSRMKIDFASTGFSCIPMDTALDRLADTIGNAVTGAYVTRMTDVSGFPFSVRWSLS